MAGPNTPHTSRHSLLTADEVAEMLSVSLRSVRRLIKDGKLPIVHVGRSVRIRPEAHASECRWYCPINGITHPHYYLRL